MLDLLARVRLDVVTDDVNRLDVTRKALFDMLQQLDELHLPFSFEALPVDATCPGVEGRDEIQCAITPVLMLHEVRPAWECRLRFVEPRTRLNARLFVHGENSFVESQVARV